MARDGIIRIDRWATELDDSATSLSDARTMLWEAERRVRDAQMDLSELRGWLSATPNGVFCDHPETAGWECDVCHGFVPLADDVIEWIDTDNVRAADSFDLAESGIVGADDAGLYRRYATRRHLMGV